MLTLPTLTALAAERDPRALSATRERTPTIQQYQGPLGDEAAPGVLLAGRGPIDPRFRPLGMLTQFTATGRRARLAQWLEAMRPPSPTKRCRIINLLPVCHVTPSAP